MLAPQLREEQRPLQALGRGCQAAKRRGQGCAYGLMRLLYLHAAALQKLKERRCGQIILGIVLRNLSRHLSRQMRKRDIPRKPNPRRNLNFNISLKPHRERYEIRRATIGK